MSGDFLWALVGTVLDITRVGDKVCGTSCCGGGVDKGTAKIARFFPLERDSLACGFVLESKSESRLITSCWGKQLVFLFLEWLRWNGPQFRPTVYNLVMVFTLSLTIEGRKCT